MTFDPRYHGADCWQSDLDASAEIDIVRERARTLLRQRIGDAIVLARAIDRKAGTVQVDLSGYGTEIRAVGSSILEELEALGWTIIRNANGPRTLMLHNEKSLEEQRLSELWADI